MVTKIAREKLQQVVDAGYPDDALVGVTVGMVREILRFLPVETIAPVAAVVVPATGATA